MKKRLRKKRHLGEFTEFGFDFVCEWKEEQTEQLSIEQENILNSFVDFCESNGWDCGGGADTKQFSMVVSRSRRPRISQKQATNISLEDRDLTFDWLIKQNVFKFIKITDLIDMWNAGDKIYETPNYIKVWNQ